MAWVFRQSVRVLDGHIGAESRLTGRGKRTPRRRFQSIEITTLHSKEALAAGETAQRIVGLDAWREAPFYSERERAALAWTEALAQVARDQVPDAVYGEARAQFSERELVDLSVAVLAISGWNQLCVGFRAEAGSYRVGMYGRR